MPVNTEHDSYNDMADRWKRCRDVASGSDAVKAEGVKYLPKPAGMDEQDYLAYRMRAVVFDAFPRTVEALAGAIFQKAVAVKAPSLIAGDLDDITLSGESLEMLALSACREVLEVGRCGILVEMAAEVAKRPYWVLWRTEDIVSWRTERRSGDEVLTRVVLREQVEELDDKDEFELVRTVRYRVLSLGAVANEAGETTGEVIYFQDIWEKKSDTTSEWVLVKTIIPERRGEPLNFIPFVFVNASSVTTAVERPPLVGLADMVLSHYRSSADREHSLYWVSMPTPWVSGAKGDGQMKIGSSVAWDLEDGGKAGMLEHSGQGIGAIKDAMEEKKALMAILGARVLESQSMRNETATAVMMRHGGEHASLRTISRVLDRALTWTLRVHAWWSGTGNAVGDVETTVQTNKDFVNVRMSAEDLRGLMLLWQSDGISFETLQYNLERGELSRPGVGAQEELAAIRRGGGAVEASE